MSVPAGSNVGAVLDAAVAGGCILMWDHASFAGFGRYVTCIDHVCEVLGTYWAFRVDGEYSSTGIDDTYPVGGETLLFTYEQWVVQIPA